MTLRDYDNYSCPGCGEQAPAGTTKAGWDHHMATCHRLALLAADDGEGGLT